MSANTLLPSLIFMTLIAGAGFALLQLLLSLQRRSTRAAVSDALVGDEAHAQSHGPKGLVPDGALPELLAVVAIAAVAMGLLTFGYLY